MESARAGFQARFSNNAIVAGFNHAFEPHIPISKSSFDLCRRGAGLRGAHFNRVLRK